MDGINPAGFGAQEQAQEAPAHARLPIRSLLVALVVIALALAAGLFFFSGAIPNSTEQADVDLPGLLIMSIQTGASKGFPVQVIPTQYAPSVKDFLTPPVDKLATSVQGGTVAYQHRLSDVENWVTFVGAVGLREGQSLSTMPLQVYRANTASATYDTITSVLQQAQAITNDDMYKQFPAVSDDGDVVYMARPMTAFGSTAGSWSIYLAPATGGEPQFLAKGVSPQWLDSNTILFMADDGLRAFRIKERYVEKLWGVNTPVTDDVVLNLSRDKRFIAIAFPQLAKTHIFRSLSGNANDLTLRGTISAPASYPVIAPDDSMVALQTAVPAGKGLSLTIQFYDLETLQRVSAATIDVAKVFPAIQASATIHASAHAPEASDEARVGGLVSSAQPLAVVLTDWIP